ncbi:hypothetical protein DUNSADRAFT_5942 [Dunaliella salina]|uniref:Encoded protein n=1 Tax=Dunaliella salina TaxID=3046 RepID=A0ABQ7GPA4_DUNSA|nr:hypothetical protein DUNSADRAFT_5942 [Dunaliella salina]|eukprot:KAF5836436.1 hypothetical protein DUNSADRAFT_5942 [Dunaliella salina]
MRDLLRQFFSVACDTFPTCPVQAFSLRLTNNKSSLLVLSTPSEMEMHCFCQKHRKGHSWVAYRAECCLCLCLLWYSFPGAFSKMSNNLKFVLEEEKIAV